MRNRFTQRQVFFALFVALLWFFLHPLSSDQVSLPVMGIAAVSLLISSVSVPQLIFHVKENALAFLLVAALGGLSTISSVLVVPGAKTLRTLAIVGVILLLGYLIGWVSGLVPALAGVLVGSVLVSVAGWVLRLDDPELLVLDPFSGAGDFVGLTGNQGYEFFSALVGVAVGLELLLRTSRARVLILGGAAISAITLVWTGSIVGLGSLSASLLTFTLVALLRGRKNPFVASLPWALGGLGLIVVALSVANRSVTLEFVGALGKSNSLEARMLSWQYALQSSDPLGLFFGHGVSFWSVGSSYREKVGELLSPHNYGPFSHAHNSYVDLLLAFGIVGLILLGLSWRLFARGLLTERGTRQLVPFVWVIFVALAVQGLGESILIFRPLGWLVVAIVAGALLSQLSLNRPGYGKEIKSGEWAPSGSN